jgi:hypothetical protein
LALKKVPLTATAGERQQREPVMTPVTSVSLSSSAAERAEPFGLLAEIRSFWREFFTRAFRPYRPELHYMRGPGPAWQAKYGPKASFRVRVDFD